MRILTLLLAFALILSVIGISYGEDVERQKKSSGGNEVLTGAVLGGLLGGGVGAAIGSASGRAGTGAAIGAGVGALGGTVIGADQASKRAKAEAEAEYSEESQSPKSEKDIKVKKRIIREYDEQGNVVSEKEVKD